MNLYGCRVLRCLLFVCLFFCGVAFTTVVTFTESTIKLWDLSKNKKTESFCRLGTQELHNVNLGDKFIGQHSKKN